MNILAYSTMRALRLFLDYHLMTSEPVRVNGTTLRAREFLRAHLFAGGVQGARG